MPLRFQLDFSQIFPCTRVHIVLNGQVPFNFRCYQTTLFTLYARANGPNTKKLDALEFWLTGAGSFPPRWLQNSRFSWTVTSNLTVLGKRGSKVRTFKSGAQKHHRQNFGKTKLLPGSVRAAHYSAQYALSQWTYDHQFEDNRRHHMRLKRDKRVKKQNCA